ncbi:MAG: hypothetical protein EBS84_21475 [Proteobacteria bacterium]|nr:hypothetical protein [Verrucomicrobiota bacterium]NBU11541.1 hypothetical protein [Pseudomonadota bacterium]NDE99989.1 hypothetical protein [Verrucomicrobiota bacterium]
MSDDRTYFAKVENGIVTDVRVVAWDFIVANPDRYGDPSLWVETFRDGSQRGKYAGIGDFYDAVNDVFVSPATEVAEPLPE